MSYQVQIQVPSDIRAGSHVALQHGDTFSNVEGATILQIVGLKTTESLQQEIEDLQSELHEAYCDLQNCFDEMEGDDDEDNDTVSPEVETVDRGGSGDGEDNPGGDGEQQFDDESGFDAGSEGQLNLFDEQ